MALFIVISREDKPDILQEAEVTRKLVLGNSVYCDVVLDDKSVATMQCEIVKAKTGHIVAKSLDGKREVLHNQIRLKKSALKIDDVLKMGPFTVRIDPTKLTEEELAVLNTDYEEYI